MPSQFLVTIMAPLLRLFSVSMATSMEITFDHSFVLDPSFWGASLSEASQIPSFPQTSMPNLDPFFTSSFDCNFQTNDISLYTQKVH